MSSFCLSLSLSLSLSRARALSLSLSLARSRSLSCARSLSLRHTQSHTHTHAHTCGCAHARPHAPIVLFSTDKRPQNKRWRCAHSLRQLLMRVSGEAAAQASGEWRVGGQAGSGHAVHAHLRVCVCTCIWTWMCVCVCGWGLTPGARAHGNGVCRRVRATAAVCGRGGRAIATSPHKHPTCYPAWVFPTRMGM